MASSPTLHQAFQPVPQLATPLVTGNGGVSIPWYRFFISLWNLLGGTTGNPSVPSVLALAEEGVANAATAQATANAAQTQATAAVAAANAAVATANAALAAVALRATIANPNFTGAPPQFGMTFVPYANDAAAAAGGIALNQMYFSSTTSSLTQRQV